MGDGTDGGARVSQATMTAWADFVRVGQAVLAAVEADLKAAGFPPLVWYDVLLELGRAGEAGLRPGALQQRMLLAQYNLSRLLDRMARDGLVERRPCADDARGHSVHATAAGLALRQRMWPAYRAAVQARFAGRFSDMEAATLSALLAKLG
ncbi:MAG: MarR family transcriptional regulator [Alphaproteobacteria bacterium]